MTQVPTPSPLTNPRIVAIPVAYNEAHAIGKVLDRLRAQPGIDMAVVDDASTDGTADIVQQRRVTLIRQPSQEGIGAGIRTAYSWARKQGYDICVTLSANDKDRPGEIPRLIEPILQGEADLVQGSRYLPGGVHEHMPAYRRISSGVVHPWLFRMMTGRRMTDTTNGFRALRLSVLGDPCLNLDQEWLNRYELEPYLLLKAIALGYAVCEVPVTKIYPTDGRPYTKMRPVVDWWSILRPILLVALRVKR